MAEAGTTSHKIDREVVDNNKNNTSLGGVIFIESLIRDLLILPYCPLDSSDDEIACFGEWTRQVSS